MPDISGLLDREGGFVDNPADKGGPTNFGITEQTARAYGYVGDMRSLGRALASEIYTKQYWLEPGFALVNNSMPDLAEELFDTGVNMGPKTVTKMLQRALNVLNREHSDYPDIVVDGSIGNMTLAALRGLLAKRGADTEKVLLKAVNGLQICRYIEIAEHDPSQETFEFGWILNRG